MISYAICSGHYPQSDFYIVELSPSPTAGVQKTHQVFYLLHIFYDILALYRRGSHLANRAPILIQTAAVK